MKAKEFVPASKPRNFVAKNQKTAGAGAHKDKKRAEKQGDVKHKQKQFAESVTEGPLELNTPNPVVVIQDLKGKVLDKLNLSVAAQKYKLGQPQDIKKQLANQNYTTIGNYVIVAPMSGQPQDKTTQGVAERVRDPEDWDEGNTEPPNNFAVYINGKKWKVFKGRGQFADDYKEIQHYRQLQSWAQKKSDATGKKWTVSITGEQATESVEEGWKDKLAAAGLAGAMAFGAAGGANARVLPGADPSINRLTGQPVATQQATQQDKASDAEKDSGQQKIGFSTEYLKKVADGKHPRPMISVDDAKKELERRGEL